MRDLLILLLIFSVVPMVFLRPHVGILAWCWISYMNPHRLTWGLAYEFPVAMVVGIATLIAWALSKESKKLPLNPVSVLLLAFVFWMSFANLFAMVPDLAFQKWTQSIKILLMTFATMALMRNRERLHALIWIIVLSLGFYGAKGGLFTALGGGASRVWGPPGSFIADNNALAMALIMCLPLVRYLQLQTESKLIRMGLYGLMILFALSIVGSQSRGAFLGGVAMAGFLIIKSRQRFIISLLVAGFMTAGVFYVPQHWIDRMKTIETYQQDSSALSRLEVWQFAIKVARDRPLTGGGFRASYNDAIYLKYVPDARKGRGRNYHSVYFEILGELGYVGLLIYLSVLWAAWRSGSRVIAQTRNRPELHWACDLARMVHVSLVGFAIAGAFQNLAFFDLYFHLIAIVFLAGQIVLIELAKEGSAGRPLPAGPRQGTRPHALDGHAAGS
ncbi:putative O-glycosylation ligase, exosortase A system-associated [Pelagibius marinus]|uniref:putative O-glycosylation ligase, exosortase A system-associated n=1 Tax=Pelagibius marinus TaxID=2762760 RepID=UPI0018727B79|nr:putative O-glycosylation ligase, exosortase A system-associated [Pelagibius marinus]